MSEVMQKTRFKLRTDNFRIGSYLWYLEVCGWISTDGSEEDSIKAESTFEMTLELTTDDMDDIDENCELGVDFKVSVGRKTDGWFFTMQNAEEYNYFSFAGDMTYSVVKLLTHAEVYDNESILMPGGAMQFSIDVCVKDNINTCAAAQEFPIQHALVPLTEHVMLSELSSDLREISMDSTHSDFHIICCDGASFPCHRAILAARSSFFRAMFASDMKENASGKMELADADAETVRDLLDYFYTARVHDLSGRCCEMLSLADRFDLPALKAACENEMTLGISVENAIDRFITADLHRAEKLRRAAKDVIVANSGQIVGQEGWYAKLGEHAREISEAFAKK